MKLSREGNEREILRSTKFIFLPIQRIYARRFSSQMGFQLCKSPPLAKLWQVGIDNDRLLLVLLARLAVVITNSNHTPQ